MSKVVGLTALLTAGALGVIIACLAINIVILGKVNDVKKSMDHPSPAPSPNPIPNNAPCANGNVNHSDGYSEAAAYLLNGLDETVDPCEDFYAFTCNKFLGKTNLNGMPRIGTYDMAQTLVNAKIGKALDAVTAQSSKTEQITKQAYLACVANAAKDGQKEPMEDRATAVHDTITSLFGDAPFLAGSAYNNIPISQLFKSVGILERQHALPTLFFSWVTTDYLNITQNALYVSQPNLQLPYDYYVKPAFVADLQKHVQDVQDLLTQFAKDLKKPVDAKSIKTVAEQVVNFEVSIALASLPDDLMRNYRQQYNPYKLAGLNKAYSSVAWSSYLDALLGDQNNTQVAEDMVVLNQPSYVSWLNSLIADADTRQDIVVNYIITQLIFDNYQFLGWQYRDIAHRADYMPALLRRGRGARRIGARSMRKVDEFTGAEDGCIDLIMAYMPYGPGYVYVKNEQNRYDVRTDLAKQTSLIIESFLEMQQTLSWMTDKTKAAAKDKAKNLIQNIGWPKELFGDVAADFANTTKIDAYHVDYEPILKLDVKTQYYEILNTLKKGLQVREAFKLLTEVAHRSNFLQSPAMVNAWYQPERNSITFPLAVANPPYYNITFPQAYNYAGQGGTGGHELTHGYDDEGVQFGPHGELSDCGWNSCGWMDTESKGGFVDMAQCVVSQFSEQCCPLKTGNVHCANGATTQGENIADLGGQQAAFKAYRKYISQLGHEEDLLPGMEKYTPNQVFWITYGYSWCMKQSDASLVKQLLTNPHSPGSCRTNQVMQDIPQFGKDFGCRRGQAMFPQETSRCKVWVGF